ncbi:hypothetical protein K449DRAFT_467621 [Hypoxylon sp. EC38]|nr:hypothetical protein K449DRAFT_467621 [Hypoxylon sp. EC38]
MYLNQFGHKQHGPHEGGPVLSPLSTRDMGMIFRSTVIRLHADTMLASRHCGKRDVSRESILPQHLALEKVVAHDEEHIIFIFVNPEEISIYLPMVATLSVKRHPRTSVQEARHQNRLHHRQHSLSLRPHPFTMPRPSRLSEMSKADDNDEEIVAGYRTGEQVDEYRQLEIGRIPQCVLSNDVKPPLLRTLMVTQDCLVQEPQPEQSLSPTLTPPTHRRSSYLSIR